MAKIVRGSTLYDHETPLLADLADLLYIKYGIAFIVLFLRIIFRYLIRLLTYCSIVWFAMLLYFRVQAEFAWLACLAKYLVVSSRM
jgi:hypothetical protein